MTAFFALFRTDLSLFLRNRRALIMGLLAPVAIAAFFGYVFDPGRLKVSRIPVAVTDLDRSPLSAQVLAGLRNEPALTLTEMSEDAAAAAVVAGKQRVAIVLPAGLARAAPAALFGAAAPPVITLRHDPSQAMLLPLVKGLLTQQLMGPVSAAAFGGGVNDQTLTPLRARAQAGAGLSAEQARHLDSLFDSLEQVQSDQVATAAASASAAVGPSASAPVAGLRSPFTTLDLASAGKLGHDYNSYAHSFAGMGVQFILMQGIEFGVALLLMRRMGLWQRLRASPISRSVLLGSRIASAALIALCMLLAIYAAAAALFGVRISGSVLGFAGIALAFALLTASFGLLIAAIGRTPEATRGLAILATLLMVMLGGAWVPSFLFPDWLQTLSLAMPTRWAVDGLDAVTWRGQGLDAALAPIGVMLAFATGFTLLALWRFDWQEG